MPAIQNLVEHIVDYAGLFPPAALDLTEVIENYAGYSRGGFSWMLGRLIVPASRLSEFSSLAAEHLPKTLADGWMISALLPPADPGSDTMQVGLEAIANFNQRHQDAANGLASVDTIEIKASTAEQVSLVDELLPDGLTAFIELPHADDPTPLLTLVAHSRKRLFGKIRTGGVTRDLIPPANQVARFIRSCVKHHVGFKATAGLHHPLRGKFPLTYEEKAERGMMYGFLNVFAAACFAYGTDASQADLVEILKESDPTAFEFSDLSLSWKNLDVTTQRISEIRMRNAISFGSCSFQEPTAELSNLGLLANVRA